MLIRFLDKHDFRLFMVLFYGLCYLMIAPFGEGPALLVSALILWLILLVPVAYLGGLLLSSLISLWTCIKEQR